MSKFQSRHTYHLLLLLLLGTKINLPVVQERMLWLICERYSIQQPCSTYLFVSYKLSKFQRRQTNHLLLLFLLGTKINLPPVVREGMDALVDLLKKFKMTTLQHLPLFFSCYVRCIRPLVNNDGQLFFCFVSTFKNIGKTFLSPYLL